MAHAKNKPVLRALILDDDQDASEFLRFRLRQAFPALEVECSIHPHLSRSADLFFFDNSFGGQKMVTSLVRQARLMNPDALIVLYSGDLDARTLREAMNCGCNGVWDKSDPIQFDAVRGLVHRFVSRRQRQEKGSIGATLDSIANLLGSWRDRIRADQVREAQR